jgi:molecular chaperone GrpE (heat shock protein)/DNA-binding Xre family transcriptional regulator
MTESLYPTNHQRLQELMQQAGISDLEKLSQLSGVSRWQLMRLQCGLLSKMRVEILLQLAQVLQLHPLTLLSEFSPEFPPLLADTGAELTTLKQEYQRLQEELGGQRQALEQEFQQSSLAVLEPLLLQLPTAAAAAVENPQLSATNLLPLLTPVSELLQRWGIETIAAVGEEVPYNPQWHELMEGAAEPGNPVKVRYIGYRQGEKLLYRARVSPAAI